MKIKQSISKFLGGRGNLFPFVTQSKSRPSRSSFGRGLYEVVTAPFTSNRRWRPVETDGEDAALPADKRGRLVALHRDMMRNSPTRVAQDQQLRVNVVGSVGGKMYASFPKGYEEAADTVMRYFNRHWFPRAEFTFRESFNWILKTALTAMDTGGNVILVFDDGILTGGNGTGRIRAFEGDEIADIDKFDGSFPEGYRQSQGFVYNPSGMFCGAFVSTSQRGSGQFVSEKGVMRLSCDPYADAPTNWVMLGDAIRFNQGRGISPVTSALATMVDLHETSANEALAAKYNAKMIAQLIRTGAEGGGDVGGGAFYDDADGGVGGDGDAVVADMVQLRNSGIAYQDMPEGLRMELLDTKHPNTNMPQYLDFLAGSIGGTRGMARVYSTLKAETSYTAFRGEQVITWPSFEEMQKKLERNVCDWAAKCVINRAIKMREISVALPDGWEDMIAWTWPKMREVSEKDAQSALQMKLQNGVTSLTRELGPGEFVRIMAERAAEKAAFDEAGLIYPGETSVSGAIKTETVEDDGTEEETKGDENDEEV